MQPDSVSKASRTEAKAKLAGLLKRRRFWLENFLWFLAVAGIGLRFVYPFYDNPLYHVGSDPSRHWDSAIYPNSSILNAADALGYQIWLASVLRITSGSDQAIAIGNGLLSAITPLLWYGWFRESQPTKLKALIALVFVCWLPDWIQFAGLFMEENLLLPLVGLSLWFGWRAKRLGTLADYLIFGLASGCSLITKAISFVPLAITWLWLVKELIGGRNRCRHAWSKLFLSTIICLTICALAPLKFWCYCHSLALVLPAYSQANRQYYESGAKLSQITFRYRQPSSNQIFTAHADFGSPSFYTPQFGAFSQFIPSRTGTYVCTMDFTRPFLSQRCTPQVNFSLLNRLRYTLENCLYFLVGYAWPGQTPYSPGNEERLLWPLIAFAALFLAKRNKRYDPVFWLFFGSLLVFLLQQFSVMEGRFRMLWEALAIAALVSQFARAQAQTYPHPGK